MKPYEDFLKAKVRMAESFGFEIRDSDVNPLCKPHQVAAIVWAVAGGRRAIFKAFGLGKTFDQIEIVRIVTTRVGGMGLIVLPLGVRQEFMRDANTLATGESPAVSDAQRAQLSAWQEGRPDRIPHLKFVRSIDECDNPNGIYLTNYETVRDGKLDPQRFCVVSLDEADCLRGFGGSKTFREFMATIAGDDRRDMHDHKQTSGVPYRFVATATPSPNEYIELLAYCAFLGVMDVGQAKTRFFKRNSEKADQLTIHPHKEREFWMWMASWALFVQRPSDLDPAFSDDGYELPELDVRWHEIPSDHAAAGDDHNGQGLMFKHQAIGVVDAAREKRESLAQRVAKLLELRAEDPDAHRIIWHDLEVERHAIEKAIPSAVTVYGTQDLTEREGHVIAFSDGDIHELASKPVLLGSGCNFQRHCSWEIFLGIGFKFKDFIQAIHRVHRFLQPRQVRIDLIYTEAEREVRRNLERKWAQDKELRNKMTAIIREYGLSRLAMAQTLTRKLGVERVVVKGDHYTLINNDCVDETRRMADNSVGLILTSIPFSTQYEYSPNFADFGHTDTNEHFFQQMDFLVPELLRVLQPGRVAAIHVKNRIVPSGMVEGVGFQTEYPFDVDTIACFRRHGFHFVGRKTIVTDVVRENNQTYRLGWSEQCKDGSRMGFGLNEYLLIFRKAPTDASNGYADQRVTKEKSTYTRARWQFDAHGFGRSSGDRLLRPEELEHLPHDVIFKLFKQHSLQAVYNFEHDVKIADAVAEKGMLPSTFMLLQPQSWSEDVWTDITRMRTLNGAQSAAGREMHLCLARDSKVLTKERGYVPIQYVQIGEHVLTHKGRWRAVRIVRETGIQPAITVRAQGVPGLTLTPDHKLWMRKSDWARERDGAERAEPRWIEAQETLGGYVNLKLPEAEQHEGDETLWWTVGRWIADGHIDQRGSAIISCGPAKWENFIAKIGDFGGNTPHIGTAMQLQLRDPGRKLRTILEQCGRGAADKRIPPAAYTLSTTQAAALLEGYLSGDGHLVQGRENWLVSSVSRDLLLGLSFLIQRVHGAIASIHAGRPDRAHVIEGRVVHARQEWNLSFDVPGGRKRPFILDDGAWKRVRAIEDAGEVETWCLRVEEDESFTAEGCIVKNCPMQFDIADRAITQYSMEGETIYDPFGGLMTVPYRAVRLKRKGLGCELSPSYFADGAIYCKAIEQEMSMPSLFDFEALEAEAA